VGLCRTVSEISGHKLQFFVPLILTPFVESANLRILECCWDSKDGMMFFHTVKKLPEFDAVWIRLDTTSQRDRRTDRNSISVSRVSMLTVIKINQ